MVMSRTPFTRLPEGAPVRGVTSLRGNAVRLINFTSAGIVRRPSSGIPRRSLSSAASSGMPAT